MPNVYHEASRFLAIIMDDLLAIGLGFAMRLLVNNLSPYHLRVQSAILGVWEGVVLHHFIRKTSSPFDPSVAYGFRIFADLVYTRNVVRMALVVLWSTVAFLICVTMGPRYWSAPVGSRKKRPRKVVCFKPDSPDRTFFRSQSIIRPRPPPDSPTPVRQPIPALPHIVRYSLGERTPQPALGAQLTPFGTLDPVETLTEAILDGQDPQKGLAPLEIPDVSFYLSDAELDDLENRYSPTGGHSTSEADTAAAASILPQSFEIDLLVDETKSEDITPTVRIAGLPSVEGPLGFHDIAISSQNLSPSAIEDAVSTLIAEVTSQKHVSEVDEDKSVAESSQTLANTESAIVESDPLILRQEAEQLRQAALAEDRRQRELECDQRLRSSTKRAFLLKQEIKISGENSIKLHKAAERRYFRSYNIRPNKTSIDLHGLRVREAVHRTEIAVHDAFLEGRDQLRVIVGRGVHSVGGRAVLKPAVIEAMRRHRIQVDMDRRNNGLLILTWAPIFPKSNQTMPWRL